MSASANDSKRLVNDVIPRLDRRLRPIENQTSPIQVYVSFYLLGLLEIDEVQQRVQISAWVNFSWWDEIRTWDPSDYNGIDVIYPDPLDIWRPRTVLANSLGPRDTFDDDYAPLTVLSTGSTRWFPGTIFYLSCKLDLTYFPFDTQTCSASFIANEQASEIRLLPTAQTDRTGGYIPNGEWDLRSSTSKQEIIKVADQELVNMVVSFTFSRRPLYYMINVVIPVMTLSFLSSMGFVLPKESGERASFSITVLLSLAVFLGVVSNQLPPSSDTYPIIGLYLFEMLCLSTFTVVITVVQMRIESSLSGTTLDVCSDDNYTHQSDDDKSKEHIHTGNTITRGTADVGTFNSITVERGDVLCAATSKQNGDTIKTPDASIIQTNKEKHGGVNSRSLEGRLKRNSRGDDNQSDETNSSMKVRIMRICLSDLVLFAVVVVLWIGFTTLFLYQVKQEHGISETNHN